MSLPLRLKADLALALVSFIWGATFVVVQAALVDASPLVFVLLRFALAAALLFVIFRRRGSLREPGMARAGMVLGFFLAAGYAFQTIGLKYTTPAKSAFITALSVVMVPLVLVLVFRRRLRAVAVAGVGTATVGLYYLTVPAGEFTISRGDLITLFCALAFAGHIVAIGHYAPRHSVAGLAVWQVAAGLVWTAVALPLTAAAGLEAPRLAWSPRLAGALLVTAVLATALAFSIQTWAQRFTSATHTALLFSLEPVFAALSSYLLLGELLSGRGWLGAGLILAGVLLAELPGAAPPVMPGAPSPANAVGPRPV